MHRRHLLAGAVAATAAAQTPAERRVKIAFLGTSHSHGEGKLAVVRANPIYELAGVWEPDANHTNVKTLSREEILQDPSIQVIAVESNVSELAKHARAALQAGKHVHVEKPPTSTLAEFQDLQKIAASQKRILQVGYMWRYNPGVVRIFELVKQGWLGDVFLVRAMMNTHIEAKIRPDWARFKGGDMFEQGSHLIDFMVRLMGKPTKVMSVLRKHGREFHDNLADNTAVILEWPGALGVLTATALQQNARLHRFMEVQGTNGTAVLRPIEDPVLALDLVNAAGPYSKGAQRVQLPSYRRYEADFEELAECVLQNKPLSSATPEQDLAVHQTLLRASEML